MARLSNKLLFFTTSPRTPSKMIPEIKLLSETFEGRKWDNQTQEQFIDELAKSDFFEGNGSPSNKAFSARDRINRAPKALGFVDLSPSIALTDAGKELVYGKRPQEIFLRQLLKFQIPSPYHVETDGIEGTFCIKPYLEILRSIRELDYLTFDELKIYGLQLTDYRNFEEIKNKILQFRTGRTNYLGRYKLYSDAMVTETVKEVYGQRIEDGNIKTRENSDDSLDTFISTQKHNMNDYTDACFRYLRYTGLVSIAHAHRSISIAQDKVADVDYILSTVSRTPVYIDDVKKYKEYLFDSSTPVLYTDDKSSLILSVARLSGEPAERLYKLDVNALKDKYDDIVAQQRDEMIHQQVDEIKSYSVYDDIMKTFSEITNRDYYDAPLMLEYNTWRAMTMLDGGNIKGNFKFDDMGEPLSTAGGNMSDIECYYDDYSLSVEVTMQQGQRQYESEGEPVARHYGKLKKGSGKDTYCLFIAPSINPSTYAFFYGLNHVHIDYYGGKSKIIPLTLEQFMQLLKQSKYRGGQRSQKELRDFLDVIMMTCDRATDENDWGMEIQACVTTWLKDDRAYNLSQNS